MKSYSFKTRKETLGEVASTAASIGIFGAAAAILVSPLALGAAAVYTALGFLSDKRDKNKPLFKENEILPVLDSSPFIKTVNDISARMGLAETPKVYILNERGAAQKCLYPYGLNWLGKTAYGRKKAKAIMPDIFMAVPEKNAFVTTREALAQIRSSAEAEFMLAHEMGHLKTDKKSILTFGHKIIYRMRAPLLAATALLAIGLSIAPLAGGLAGVAALVSTFAMGNAFAGLICAGVAALSVDKAGSRIVEKRADRNALYVTRDLPAAEDMLSHGELEKVEKTSKLSAGLESLLSTHPHPLSRIQSLRKAFPAISAFPAPTAAAAAELSTAAKAPAPQALKN